MATLVFTNPYLVLDGVNLTGYVRKVTLKGVKAVHEDTANTAGTGVSARTYVGGLKEYGFEPVFNFALGAGLTEATLWAIWNAGTAVGFTCANAGSTAGTANPHYSGSALITDFAGVDGAIGEKGEAQPVFKVTGDIARALA